MTRRGLLCLWLLAGACVEPGTALRLSVSTEAPLVALRLSLQPAAGVAPVVYRLPEDGSAPSLPGVVVLRLPDVAADVAVLLSGDTSDGRTLTAQGAVHCLAREVCALSVMLALPRSPAGVSCDDPSQCASGFCAQGVCCDQACDGGCNTCAAADGASAEGTCTLRKPKVVCRPKAGDCDLDDLCDGVTGACPDARAAAGTVCRAAVAGCDLAEVCDGVAADCPANLSTCTAGNYCSPSGSCTQANPIGSTCTDASMCGSGFCAQGVCCDTACTGACERCNGKLAANEQPGKCQLVPAGALACRASTGACDPAELCNGIASDCPADQKSALITTLLQIDTSGTGAVTSQPAVSSSLLVGCPGILPSSSGASRVFATFNPYSAVPGSSIVGVQLFGCVLSGVADVTAYPTKFSLPLDATAYGATVGAGTALPPSTGSTHSEVTSLPVDTLSQGMETQLELRATNEACGPGNQAQRVYANGGDNSCPNGRDTLQLIVSSCSGVK